MSTSEMQCLDMTTLCILRLHTLWVTRAARTTIMRGRGGIYLCWIDRLQAGMCEVGLDGER